MINNLIILKGIFFKLRNFFTKKNKIEFYKQLVIELKLSETFLWFNILI